MRPIKFLLALNLIGITIGQSAAGFAAPIRLAEFPLAEGPVPAPWQAVRLGSQLKPTDYRLTREEGIVGIEARAHASMSLMGRPLSADLSRTPILCWRWRIDAPLQGADLATKAGDDYAARVYVALRMPPQSLSLGVRAQLRLARALYGESVPDAALNYVWDNRYPVGTVRPNAYTARTHMWVVNTGPALARRWVTVRRDLTADIARSFPNSGAQPVLLAVATDTDNTGEQARAVFADFTLVARDQACPF